MILTRSPLRITLGGGGTDIPGYYLEHGGFVLTAAIDKYVYVALQENFNAGLIVKYSEVERCLKADEVKHPIVREALKHLGIDSGLEIVSMADVPAGTGLGSSGSFTTALLLALCSHSRVTIGKEPLAELAAVIEIEKLGEPVGRQDQYAAAFGGLQSFKFDREGISVEPIHVSPETVQSLQDGLMLFYTGQSRSASRTLSAKPLDVDALNQAKLLGVESLNAIEDGDLRHFAELLDHSWQQKRKTLSTPEIDQMYCAGRKAGAIAGKLVGAGMGGFMMFFTENRMQLRRGMIDAGYRELPFAFDFAGATRVI